MPAIVTNKFRVSNAELFKQAIADQSVYVGIAKSDVWSDSLADNTDSEAPTPLDTQNEIRDFQTNAIAYRLLTSADVSHVVPRHNWQSGNAYTAWDDRDNDIHLKEFYVVTDEFKVYKCIEAGAGSSVIKPTQTDINGPVTESDGYTWKYMYTIQANDADRYLTNNFMPVKTVVIPDGGTINDLTTDDQTQYSGQEAAKTGTTGAIYSIIVEDGGSGYTSKPTVTVSGDGSGFNVDAADITLNNGSIESIDVTAAGTGYTNAVVEITGGGGTGASAYPVLTPYSGHGGDPVRELGAFYSAVNTKLDGEQGNGDFIVDNDFRQIGLVMNPYSYGTSSVATDGTLSALTSFNLTTHSGLQVNDYVTGSSSGTQAFIDAYDVDTGVIKVHQNDKTGYGDFQVGETVNGSLGGSGVIDVINNPEIDRTSGELIFIESRSPVNRASTQIEDIKVIIEF